MSRPIIHLVISCTIAIFVTLAGMAQKVSGQTRNPVGAHNRSTGSANDTRLSPKPSETGPWTTTGQLGLPEVNLNANPTSVYLIAPRSTTPNFLYAGFKLVSGSQEIPMTVIMFDESKPLADNACNLATFFPVFWNDIVKARPDITANVVGVLPKMHEEAATSGGRPYRLMWCPAGGNPVGRNWNPTGRSSPFRLKRDSVVPTPGVPR